MKHLTKPGLLLLLLLSTAWHTQTTAEEPPVTVTPLAPFSENDAFTITGKTVDEAGTPISGVAIRWWEQERPEGLRNITGPPPALSDTKGSFTLTLPSQFVHYFLTLSRDGYNDVEQPIYGPTPSLRIVLEDAWKLEPFGGTVTWNDKSTQATVNILRRDGQKALRIETDSQGNFTIQPISELRSYPFLYAESGNLRSPLRAVIRPGSEIVLELQTPGSLEGNVVSAGSEQALPGATVEIFNSTGSTHIRTLTTDKSGRFVAATLPPGAVTIRFDHPRYGEPIESTNAAHIKIGSGETTTIKSVLSPKPTISGQVLGFDGTPIANAWVGCEAKISTSLSMFSSSLRLTSVALEPIQTRADGTFQIHPRHTEQTLTFMAYHPAGGLAKEKIYVPASGEESKGIQLVLSGAIRVQGTVQDEKGNPLRQVVMGALETDEYGVFDSGFATLPDLSKEPLMLDFIAPRPAYGHPVPGAEVNTTDPDQAYFLHQTVPLELHPGQAYSLEITLARTRAITFTGTVTDYTGKAVPGTRVALEYGNNTGRMMAPKRRPRHSVLGSLKLDGGIHPPPPFNGALTDDAGKWSLTLPVETPASLRVAYADRLTSQWVNVSAELPELGIKQARRIDHLASLFDESTLDISFPEHPSGLDRAMRVSVVDHEGKPVKGLELTKMNPQGSSTIQTDDNGIITLSRKSRHDRIRVNDDRWSVIAPHSGEADIYLESLTELGKSPYNIVLGKRGSIEVTARYPDGEPAKIDGRSQDELAKMRYPDDPSRFFAENLKAGRQELTVKGPDGYRRDYEVDVPPGGVGQLDVVLPRATCTIAGRLIDSSGNPQGDLSLSIKGTDYAYRKRTDETGSFSCRVPPGSYVVEARRNEIHCLVDSYRELVTISPDDEQREIDFRVTPPPPQPTGANPNNVGELIVQVTGKNGAPLAGLQLNTELQRNRTVKMTGITDKTGYHTFKGLSAGQYDLTIATEEYGLEKRTYWIPIEPGTTRRCTVDLSQGVDFSASVTGPNTLARTEFTLLHKTAGMMITKESDSSGKVFFANVPPGPGTLWYHHPARYSQEEMDLQVHASMAPIEITLPRGHFSHTIEGRLAMIAQMSDVSLRKVGDTQVFSDYDGRTLQADALEDGTYVILITRDANTIAKSTPIVIENGNAESNIDWSFDESGLSDAERTQFRRAPRPLY